MPEDTSDIREAIERTRAELSDRLDALSKKADLEGRASAGKQKVKATTRKATKAAEKASRKARKAAQKTSRKARGSLPETSKRSGRRKLPLLAAIGGLVAAVVVRRRRRP